ncbi:hypothetical protein CLOM_g24046 [Closterium sp. NIES-68]|nr:hypothetical protein CLOM_g24046 [Closterium sp. NIES-68]
MASVRRRLGVVLVSPRTRLSLSSSIADIRRRLESPRTSGGNVRMRPRRRRKLHRLRRRRRRRELVGVPSLDEEACDDLEFPSRKGSVSREVRRISTSSSRPATAGESPPCVPASCPSIIIFTSTIADRGPVMTLSLAEKPTAAAVAAAAAAATPRPAAAATPATGLLIDAAAPCVSGRLMEMLAPCSDARLKALRNSGKVLEVSDSCGAQESAATGAAAAAAAAAGDGAGGIAPPDLAGRLETAGHAGPPDESDGESQPFGTPAGGDAGLGRQGGAAEWRGGGRKGEAARYAEESWRCFDERTYLDSTEALPSARVQAHTRAFGPRLSHLPRSTLISITTSLLSHLSLTHPLNNTLNSPHSSPLSATLCPDRLLSPPLLPSSLSSSPLSSLHATSTLSSLLRSLRSSNALPSLRRLYSIPLLSPPPPSSLSSSPASHSHHSLDLLLALRPAKSKTPGTNPSAISASASATSFLPPPPAAAATSLPSSSSNSSAADSYTRGNYNSSSSCSGRDTAECGSPFLGMRYRWDWDVRNTTSNKMNGRESTVTMEKTCSSKSKECGECRGRYSMLRGAEGLAGTCTVELIDLQKGVGGSLKQEAVIAASLPLPAASASLHISLRLGSCFPLSLPFALLSSQPFQPVSSSSETPTLPSAPSLSLSPSLSPTSSPPSLKASATTTLTFDLPSPLRALLLPLASHPLLRPLNLPSLHAQAYVTTCTTVAPLTLLLGQMGMGWDGARFARGARGWGGSGSGLDRVGMGGKGFGSRGVGGMGLEGVEMGGGGRCRAVIGEQGESAERSVSVQGEVGGVRGTLSNKHVEPWWKSGAAGFARQLVEGMRCSAGLGLVCPTSFGRVEVNYCWPIHMHPGDSLLKHGLQFRFKSQM